MSLSPPEDIAGQVRSNSTLPASPVPAAALQPPLRAFLQTGGALLATFAVGFAGGIVAKLLHFPLPYMTGSLLITAGLGLAAVPVRSLWQARAAGQFVTGAAIGSSFTPAVVGHLFLLLPLIVVGAAISIVVAGFGALMLMRMTATDAKTAFLAAMPGGVIEMANVAVRVDADPLPIMVLQTMRVGLTVCAAPFLATLVADDGTRHQVLQAETMSWLLVAGLMVVSFLGGLALWLVRLPNCWFLGSIFAIAILGSFGLVEGRVPDVILTIAQVVIGTSIGTQFRHEFLTRLLRLLLASLVTVPYALVSMALVGALGAWLLALPLPTMVLALAPAGIAEMALTGKVLGLDAAMITGFQTVRILMVTLGAAPACRIFERITTKRT
jgi:membrane AbrB-like protein